MCKDARIVESIIFEEVLRGAGGTHGLAVEHCHLLNPLRNDLTAVLKLELERPCAAYPAPFNQPDRELEEIIVTKRPEKVEFGLANDLGLPHRLDVV